MDSKYEYRKASFDDIDTIIELWIESARLHEELEPRLQYAANAQESMKKYFSDQLSKDTFIMFMASKDSEDVGFIEAQIMEKPPIHVLRRVGYVGVLYVNPQNRRNGVGNRLWELVHDWLSKQNADKFQLAVAVMNPDAIAFWHKLGFKEIFHQMERKAD